LRLLAKVETVFSVPGRGIVIVPAGLPDLKVRDGDQVQLRVPNGCTRDTCITAVESMNQGPGKPRRPAFMLPLGIEKHEIVEGTEIWLPEAREEHQKK
jgi:hypothetical protein